MSAAQQRKAKKAVYEAVGLDPSMAGQTPTALATVIEHYMYGDILIEDGELLVAEELSEGVRLKDVKADIRAAKEAAEKKKAQEKKNSGIKRRRSGPSGSNKRPTSTPQHAASSDDEGLQEDHGLLLDEDYEGDFGFQRMDPKKMVLYKDVEEAINAAMSKEMVKVEKFINETLETLQAHNEDYNRITIAFSKITSVQTKLLAMGKGATHEELQQMAAETETVVADVFKQAEDAVAKTKEEEEKKKNVVNEIKEEEEKKKQLESQLANLEMQISTAIQKKSQAEQAFNQMMNKMNAASALLGIGPPKEVASVAEGGEAAKGDVVMQE